MGLRFGEDIEGKSWQGLGRGCSRLGTDLEMIVPCSVYR